MQLKYLRERSCRLLCSLRLKAREQYWHLYFLSGVCDILAPGVAKGGATAGACIGAARSMAEPGMLLHRL